MVDSSGGGFSANLGVLRDSILRRLPHVKVDYHFVNERTLEGEARARARSELRARWAGADLVVCASDALPAQLPEVPSDQRRILLHSLRPRTVAAQAAERPPIYTDVIVQSEYSAHDAARRFPTSVAGVIKPLGLPAFDLLSMPAVAAAARRKLYEHCPRARGRRIVGVSSSLGLESILSGSDAQVLSEALAGEYFFALRTSRAGTLGASCGSSLSEFIFNSGSCFTPFELLLISDVLVTDRFSDAAYFSATGRPLVVLDADGTKEWAWELAVQSLLETSAVLGDGRRTALTAAFRDLVAAPNLEGNAERILDAVLGATS